MKRTIFSLALLLLSLFAFSQNVIQADTSITKTIKVYESFDLQFLDWDGYMWYPPDSCDSAIISIRSLGSKLLDPRYPVGGKRITTYEFVGLTKGTYALEYNYGRPWLKEKMFQCILKITID